MCDMESKKKEKLIHLRVKSKVPSFNKSTDHVF